MFTAPIIASNDQIINSEEMKTINNSYLYQAR